MPDKLLNPPKLKVQQLTPPAAGWPPALLPGAGGAWLGFALVHSSAAAGL